MTKELKITKEQQDKVRAYEIEMNRRKREALRKRKKEAIKSIAVLTVIAIFALWALIIMLTPKKVTGYKYDTCESLWELASKHCPETTDKRKFIGEVMNLNGMTSCTVQPNRLYQYPIYEVNR